MRPACGCWTTRYPSIAAAVEALACRSCLIDGEVVICGDDGVPLFDRLRYGRQPQSDAVLFAFDLLELAGKDLRRIPLEDRKRTLAKLIATYRGLFNSTSILPSGGHCISPRLQARL
jgi:bifunctional non-homologous end joining protein LigD